MAEVKFGPSVALAVGEEESPHHLGGLSWWHEKKMDDGRSLLNSNNESVIEWPLD